jgi:hypothetical protein
MKKREAEKMGKRRKTGRHWNLEPRRIHCKKNSEKN